ncbi:SunT ABC-type bacteriocin/lantibiotic exporters, contain an N-terminal double-glycine peptidase domain [Candidatus Methylopumilus universalis]|uniref:type I secretion system permease/ATPase n=1 Tax=Candidatus Methylopumilus universalis TaxID=2588536 RepID=UPI003BEF45BD
MAEVLSKDALLLCLEELCRLYKLPGALKTIDSIYPKSTKPITLDKFVSTVKKINFVASVNELSMKALATQKLPLIYFNKNNEASLLLAIENDQYHIWEASLNQASQITAIVFKAKYVKKCILIKPQLQNDGRVSFHESIIKPSSWFWESLLKYKKVYMDVILASLVVNILSIFSSLFTMNVYDRVIPNQAHETLWALAIGVFIAYIFDILLRTLRSYFVDTANKRGDNEISAMLFERVMGLRLEHRPASSGSMANTLKEFDSLRDFFTSATLLSVVDLPFVFIFILVIGWIGGSLFLVPLIAIPLIIFSGLIFQPALERAMNLNLTEASQKHGLLIESISNMETIKSLSTEGFFQNKWESILEASSASSFRSKFLATMIVNMTSFIQQVAYILIIVIGVYLIEKNVLTMGGLVACSILASRAMAPLAQISSLLIRFQTASHALRNLNTLIATEQERPSNKKFLHRAAFDGGIQFDKVTFNYPGQGAHSLDSISFDIKPGDKVAILGRVGSGKTTLLKLILGLYRPQSGSILIDGIDQNQIDPIDLRSNMGYVDQDAKLFYGTLRDNIAIVKPDATDAMILEVAKIAGVEEFAKTHPLGYEMRVGEGGHGLSGGQRQAITIARALLLNPQIILMDEPTSGMDTVAESHFIKNMNIFLKQRTLLFVTHKSSMMAMVDKIILMDAGKIVAFGPRDEVLKKLMLANKT